MLDGVDHDCTVQNNGQDEGPSLTWQVTKRLVRSVRIEFRSSDGHAQIGDLKIYYSTKQPESQFQYAVQQLYHPTLPVIASFEEKQLWLKERRVPD